MARTGTAWPPPPPRVYDQLTEEGQGYVQLMPKAVWVGILDGTIDAKRLAHEVLASRGLDATGTWVGFPEAARLHRIK